MKYLLLSILFMMLFMMAFISCSIDYVEKEEDALFQISKQLYEEKKFDLAIAGFKNIAQEFDHSSSSEKSYYYTGVCWIGKFEDTIANPTPQFQFLDSAISSCQKVTDKSDYWVKSLFEIGYSYYKLADYDRSFFYHTKVLKNFPNSSKADNALLYLGHYYRKTENLDSALICYEQLISDYPLTGAYDNGLYWAGDNYYDRRKDDSTATDKAIDLFTKYCDLAELRNKQDGVGFDDKYEKAKSKLAKMEVVR